MTGRSKVERADGIATLWLDNPTKRNAFDGAMLRKLADAARRLAADGTVRVVLLRGEGLSAFSSGADFSAFVGPDGEAGFAQRYRSLELALDDAVTALSALPQPLVAGLSGPCMGGAVQLALCADIRLASETLKLAVPAASVGLVYPLDAIRRLVALCGPATTKFMFLSGHVFSAEEALRVGLVDTVMAAGRFETEVSALCRCIAEQPKAAIAAYKKIIDCILDAGDLDALRELQDSINLSPDTAARFAAATARRRKD